MQGFPGLCALQDEFFGVQENRAYSVFDPTSPFWTSPLFLSHQGDARAKAHLSRNGLPIPAHTYSEFTSPEVSFWWTPAVRSLHNDTYYEERRIKHSFSRQYPNCSLSRPPHPDRIQHTPVFLRDQYLLHARLACCQAIFWIRACIEAGVTAATLALQHATAAALAAEAAAADAAATQYTECLLADGLLAASLGRPVSEVSLWGTAEDPRNPPPPQPLGWANTSAWGTGAWNLGDIGAVGTLDITGTAAWAQSFAHLAAWHPIERSNPTQNVPPLGSPFVPSPTISPAFAQRSSPSVAASPSRNQAQQLEQVTIIKQDLLLRSFCVSASPSLQKRRPHQAPDTAVFCDASTSSFGCFVLDNPADRLTLDQSILLAVPEVQATLGSPAERIVVLLPLQNHSAVGDFESKSFNPKRSTSPEF
ncbi:hypothetical protein B0H19DRAFT_1275000 [Mycena capillaripes]|nr:hypothetical protein B0H19DRAFT_1275000 [Mycena capillaripes]